MLPLSLSPPPSRPFPSVAIGNVSGASLYMHCGLEQVIQNNIFWGNHQSPRADKSYVGSPGLIGSCNTGGVEPQWTNISATLASNIFLLTATGSTLFNGGSFFQNESFSSNVYFAAPPVNATTALLWPGVAESTWRDWQEWLAAGQDTGSTIADPLVASVGVNFTLLPGSPALARGFQQLQQSWGPDAAN